MAAAAVRNNSMGVPKPKTAAPSAAAPLGKTGPAGGLKREGSRRKMRDVTGERVAVKEKGDAVNIKLKVGGEAGAGVNSRTGELRNYLPTNTSLDQD